MANPNVTFNSNVIHVSNIIETAVEAFLEEAAGELESAVKRNSRVDTGQLKSSWQHKVDKVAKEAVVGSPLENAIWEELGTGEFALNGNGRKTAWYVPVDGYLGRKKPTFYGKVVIVTGKNGEKFYKTNGKRPTRTFQKAKDACEPSIIQAAIHKFGSM